MNQYIDRLARNLIDLQSFVPGLNDEGVTATFVNKKLAFSEDTSSPINTLMLSIMHAFAELGYSMILELQWEGIAATTAAGKPTGAQNA